jgi:long-chain acyl-CoA synthetase
MLSHRAILAAITASIAAPGFDLAAEDRIVQALPLYHLVGLVSTFLPAATVGASVIVPDLGDALRTLPDAVLAATRDHNATVLPAEPTLYRQLCRAPEFPATARTVRLMLCGAYALNSADVAAIQETTGLTVRQGYGISESAATVTSTLMTATPRPGSVGIPYPGIEIRIVSDRDESVDSDAGDRSDRDRVRDAAAPSSGGPDTASAGGGHGPPPDDVDRLVDFVGDGEIGRIAISGPTLFSGYWVGPEEASPGPDGPSPNGWFLTGDIGFLDDDGELHLVDRVSETIVVSGFTVYPREVESVLCRHPAVADAAVVGIPVGGRAPNSGRTGTMGHSRNSGSTVVAVIVARPGATPSAPDLSAFLSDRLAPFKQPTAFQVVDTLPRTAVGRLDREAVLAGFLSGAGRLPATAEPSPDLPAQPDRPEGSTELDELGARLPAAGNRAARSDEDTDDDLF